jgi:hypothetical protein
LKKGILAIYDYEVDYAYGLMDYLNRKGNLELEVRVFTNHESLKECLRDNTIRILLVGQDIQLDDIDCIGIKLFIILTEQNEKAHELECPSIYKFQSAEHILREILDCYLKQESDDSCIHYTKGNGEGSIIGIISPSGGSGKSTFAIALGQVLSKEQKVLLLNLEAVPGQYCLDNNRDDNRQGLSDLVYYIKQKKPNIEMKLRSMVKRFNQLDYILPADHYSDLYEMNREDVVSLLEELKNKSGYDVIILDIGYINDSTFEFLKCCNKMYMTMVGDSISKEKEASFHKILSMWEGEDIMTRVHKLQVPYDEGLAKGHYGVEQIENSKLGEFINDLLIAGD